MTSEQINRKIAEACGWENIRQINGVWYGFRSGNDNAIPNYFGDLNSVHEAEKWLKDSYAFKSIGNLHREYLVRLELILNPEIELWSNGSHVGNWGNTIKCAEATAPQRCEALLRTLGLWEE